MEQLASSHFASRFERRDEDGHSPVTMANDLVSAERAGVHRYIRLILLTVMVLINTAIVVTVFF